MLLFTAASSRFAVPACKQGETGFIKIDGRTAGTVSCSAAGFSALLRDPGLCRAGEKDFGAELEQEKYPQDQGGNGSFFTFFHR